MNRRLTPVAAALLAAFSAPLALAQGAPTLPALADAQPTDAVLSDAVLSEITVHDSAKKDDFAAMKSSVGGKQATLLREALEDLSFDLVEPELTAAARWVAVGLTAYDAAYVAVAEAGALPLITNDRTILELAPGVARRTP